MAAKMKNVWIYLLILTVIGAVCASRDLAAMPPHPSIIDSLRQRGDTAGLERISARMKAQASRSIQRVTPPKGPVTGNYKVLVLLIDYVDSPFANVSTTTYYSSLLNGTSSGAFSMKRYYNDMSHGLLELDIRVHGPYHAANAKAYYGQNYPSDSDRRPAQLVREAVLAAQTGGVNFADYDNNNDGEVDVVMVIHSGAGEEVSGDDDDIWSHAWNLTSGGAGAVSVNGKTVNVYCIQPEFTFGPGDSGIGVFCHEYAHILGLPDLYDTSDATYGAGMFTVMASGSWAGPNGDGTRPLPFLAWEKNLLGWLTVQLPDGTLAMMDTLRSSMLALSDHSDQPTPIARIAFFAGILASGGLFWFSRRSRTAALMFAFVFLFGVMAGGINCSGSPPDPDGTISAAAGSSQSVAGSGAAMSSLSATGSGEAASSPPAAGSSEAMSSLSATGSDAAMSSQSAAGSSEAAGSSSVAGSSEAVSSLPAIGSSEAAGSSSVAGSSEAAGSSSVAGSSEAMSSPPAAGSSEAMSSPPAVSSAAVSSVVSSAPGGLTGDAYPYLFTGASFTGAAGGVVPGSGNMLGTHTFDEDGYAGTCMRLVYNASGNGLVYQSPSGSFISPRTGDNAVTFWIAGTLSAGNIRIFLTENGTPGSVNKTFNITSAVPTTLSAITNSNYTSGSADFTSWTKVTLSYEATNHAGTGALQIRVGAVGSGVAGSRKIDLYMDEFKWENLSGGGTSAASAAASSSAVSSRASSAAASSAVSSSSKASSAAASNAVSSASGTSSVVSSAPGSSAASDAYPYLFTGASFTGAAGGAVPGSGAMSGTHTFDGDGYAGTSMRLVYNANGNGLVYQSPSGSFISPSVGDNAVTFWIKGNLTAGSLRFFLTTDGSASGTNKAFNITSLSDTNITASSDQAFASGSANFASWTKITLSYTATNHVGTGALQIRVGGTGSAAGSRNINLCVDEFKWENLSGGASSAAASSRASSAAASSASSVQAVSLGNIETSHLAIKIPLGDPAGQQYYLVENKVKANGTWTQYLPGSGLLITHIHTGVINAMMASNKVNDGANRIHGVNIVEADNKRDLWTGGTVGVDADFFKGRNFNPSTAPSTFYYTGTSSGGWPAAGTAPSRVYIDNISAAGPTMTFQYSVR
ncbi:MAG: M6 family metalloprotease domain-containing protein [Spirochaetota bacterium]|jgi:M6 family metalloprotease-like protein|nr:M6 family metalloprotease domain-containing protein [Spirochaetota bacterium]